MSDVGDQSITARYSSNEEGELFGEDDDQNNRPVEVVRRQLIIVVPARQI